MSKGLVLNLKMSDKQGSVVTDYSRYGNDGAVSGGVVWTEQGMRFDGSTGYLDCGNDASLDITDAITISCWINETAIVAGSVGIIDKNAQYDGYLLRISDGRVKFFMRKVGDTPAYALIQANTDLIAGEWTHVVGTRDNNNDMWIYINGIKQTNTANFVSILDTSADNLIIGEYSSAFFTGTINDVRIYNYALPLREIKAMHNSTRHNYD